MLSSMRGFTLMELMIVVAIIGLLASVAIPAFSNYRQNASDNVAKSDARNIAFVLRQAQY